MVAKCACPTKTWVRSVTSPLFAQVEREVAGGHHGRCLAVVAVEQNVADHLASLR